jgi:adenine deaminase
MANYQRLLRVARGDEPADLVVHNGRLLNVLTREEHQATVGISEDTIAYVTSPEDVNCPSRQTVDASGMWLAPGLIDSHMHIESTHATPEHLANAILPRGVTTIAQDPHEIANVLGTEGVDYMRQASRGLPLRVLTFAPTCVPAVPGLETSGAAFTAADVDGLLDDPDTIGLAEIMDYWGVIRQSPRITEIVQVGRRRGVILTGHIRGLGGRELNTYLAAGIDSDHELLSSEGIWERTRLGMTVEVRCQVHGDNVPAAVEAWRARGFLPAVVFVTDDVPPHELARAGQLDRGVRRAIELGMDPVDVVRAATLVPAKRLRRHDLGAVAPGRKADLLVISDLRAFAVHLTIAAGSIVSRDGAMIRPAQSQSAPPRAALSSMRLDPLTADDFEVAARGNTVRARVIGERGRRLEQRTLSAPGGTIAWQGAQDLALAAVFHRHGVNHNRAMALLSGSGLQAGALATTYAHDSHNLVVVGRNPSDMAVAANALIECGGGYVAVSGGRTLALVRLPVAGLLAEQPVSRLAEGFEAFESAARSLGAAENPIGLLTSLPLPVLPSFRLTDVGLVDVERQAILPAFEG